MSKLLLSVAASAGLTLGFGLITAAPAAAQRQTGQIIVYGTDPCPRSTDSDVVVCYRRPESERFRIPDPLRQSGTRQERQSWTRQADSLRTVGSVGLVPCSPVGPMGVSGCAQQEISRAFRDRGEQSASEAPPPQ